MKTLKVFEREYIGLSRLIRGLATLVLAIAGYIAIETNTPDGRGDMSAAFYGNIVLFLIGAICWSYVIMCLFEILVDEQKNSENLKPLNSLVIIRYLLWPLTK